MLFLPLIFWGLKITKKAQKKIRTQKCDFWFYVENGRKFLYFVWKVVKKGSFLTLFGPIFGPFFDPFFWKSVGILIGFCKKTDFLVYPKNDQFLITFSKGSLFWNPLSDHFYGFKTTSFESKGVKKGSFLTHFWPIFDPFLTHFWTPFLTFFSKSVGIFIGFCKKPDFLGYPKNDQFLTPFWPLFDPLGVIMTHFWTPFFDHFLTIFYHFCGFKPTVFESRGFKKWVKKGSKKGHFWPFWGHFWPLFWPTFSQF